MHRGDQLLRRKATLEKERTNLIDSIAGGFNSESIRTAIIEREKEIDEINVKPGMAKSKGAVPDFERLRDFAVSKLSDLRVLLGRPDNVPEFRNMLEKNVGMIQMEPTEENGITCYLAKGRLGFLTGEEQTCWDGVAGASCTPRTLEFRLILGKPVLWGRTQVR